MKRSILFLSVLLFQHCMAQQTEVPGELKPFIKDGYELMDFVKADLNFDNLSDYVVVLKKAGEDTIDVNSSDWESPRPILLIIRKAGDKLVVAAENDELVLCKHCGGVFGDPYEGLEARAGGFSISFYGGSSWRWADNYTFSFDKQKKNWFLQKHFSTFFHMSEPEAGKNDAAMYRSEIGDITLNEFSPYYNIDSSTYEVKAPKAYFYPSPELKAKPRKGYLVKGDKIVSTKYFKNFIRCSYTNDKDEITDGYILKKDLTLIQSHKPAAIQ